MSERFDVRQLEAIETLPVGWSKDVAWRPVRHALDVGAFGINAYSVATAGSAVVEDHDELGGGAGHHEEMYVVVTGRAEFTLDGEKHDAPAGTIVAVHDPAVRRAAVATAPATTVLCIGASRGAPFRVSPWEYGFRAAAYARQGRVDEALAIAQEGYAAYPRNAEVLYNLACYESLTGELEPAFGHLLEAVALDPQAAEWAATDEDLAALRDDPRFPRS